MIYLKWFLFCVPDLLMQIVGKALSPVLPLFVRTEKNAYGEIEWKTDGSAMQAHLPKWLSWFETDDHDCDGDRGHWERHPGFDWWSTYKRRVAWFFRNTSYGFCLRVIGVPVFPSDEYVVQGNPDASDTNGISGICFRRVYRDDRLICFQWYFIRWYENRWFRACVRIGLGWKLFGNWHEGKGKVAMHQLYCNPLKKFQIVKHGGSRYSIASASLTNCAVDL